MLGTLLDLPKPITLKICLNLKSFLAKLIIIVNQPAALLISSKFSN